jgi:hypothetical protein
MAKLSKAESGKLGGLVWAERAKLIQSERIVFYDSNPKCCEHCSSALTYKQRKSKYCSRSCAATINNSKSPKRIDTKIYCTSCDKRTRYPGKCKSCTYVERFELGEISDRGTLRSHLFRLRGKQCECCKLSIWNGKEIPLELDHIDGNAGNNLPSNLRLLCPTCHAQTPTHKAKNKGNGRKARGLPLY